MMQETAGLGMAVALAKPCCDGLHLIISKVQSWSV